MSSSGRLTVFLAVALLAVTATALRDEHLRGEKSSSRKLLQPFNLGLKEGGRRSGNVGNTGERRTNGLSFTTAGLVDTGRKVNNTIRARTSSVGESSNLDFGGVGKTSFSARGNTTETTARTQTGVDVRSIGVPGPGQTGSRIIDTSNSLAAKRLKPAGAQRAATDPTLGPYDGRNDNVPAGEWEVLGAAAQDYGFAGDYDYALITAIVDDRSFAAAVGTYDDDYGTLRALPETSALASRTRTALDNNEGRAAGYGRLGTAATAPQSVSRGSVITSGLWGNNAARFNDDIFGTGTVFVPPNQFRQAGGTAAGVSLAGSQKGNPLPGATTNLQTAGTTISRNYITGGAADQVNYAAGTKSVAVRSQNAAVTGSENIDFDVGRRRLQANRCGNNLRRRLQAVRSQE